MKPVDKAPGGRPEKGSGPRGGKCPMCGKSTALDFRPFCSRRCADLDLGRWLKGDYAVPGPPGEVGPSDTDEQ